MSYGVPGGRAGDDARTAVGDIVALAVASAILTAAVHAGIVGVRQHVLHAFTQTAYEFVWVAPLSYTAIFLAVALPVWIASCVSPRHSAALAVGVFVALGVFAVLLLYRRIHPAAFFLVAVGAGVRAGQSAAVHWARWRAGLTRGALAAGVGLAFVASYKTLVPWMRERRATAAARSTTSDAPNVILLILDTVRAANLGVYGYARETSPVMDRLAPEAVVFNHAFAPAAWTLASHASMLTGRWAHETKASYRRSSDPSLPNLAQALRRRGYLTAAFMANAGWAGHESGFTDGFLRYEGHPVDLSQFLWSPSLTQMPLTREVIGGVASGNVRRIVRAVRQFDLRIETPPVPRSRDANEIADRFLAWRANLGTARPYFAMLNILDAHDPYRPPEPFQSRFGGRTTLDRYDGAIAFIDSVIGQIAEELRETGELDRTILVITSDHGEAFGEKGLRGHGESLYQPVIHVPLIVRHPGSLPQGSQRDDAVSLRDLAATLLHLVDGAPAPDLPGTSLFAPGRPSADREPLRLLVNHALNKPTQPNADGPIHGVMTDSAKFIWFVASGREELFEWRRDPTERVNLADSAAFARVRASLRAVAREMHTP